MAEAKAVAAPAQAAEPKKAKVAKEPKAPRVSLKTTLWELFKDNATPQRVIKTIAEKFPQSKFNTNTAFHFKYYVAKYNAEAKLANIPATTTAWPKEEKAKAAKAEPAVAAKS